MDQLFERHRWQGSDSGSCRLTCPGNPGKHRDLSDGVSELKIDFGPGYRVYYTELGDRVLMLLAGGDKATQQKDIKLAIHLARNLQE